MNALAPYRKAVLAAVVAFASIVLTAVSTGAPLTATLWVSAAAAAVGTLQVTWLVPNADDETKAIVAGGLAEVTAALQARASSGGQASTALGAGPSASSVWDTPAPGRHAA